MDVQTFKKKTCPRLDEKKLSTSFIKRVSVNFRGYGKVVSKKGESEGGGKKVECGPPV